MYLQKRLVDTGLNAYTYEIVRKVAQKFFDYFGSFGRTFHIQNSKFLNEKSAKLIKTFRDN